MFIVVDEFGDIFRVTELDNDIRQSAKDGYIDIIRVTDDSVESLSRDGTWKEVPVFGNGPAQPA